MMRADNERIGPRATQGHQKAEAVTAPPHAALDMAERRILISGASSGIGRSTAATFAAAGAHLVLLDIDPNGLAAVCREVAAAGHPSAAPHTVNLGEKREIDAFWESLDEATCPDTIVNNAGIYPMRDFMDVDESFLEHVLHVNLASLVWMCQGFIRARGSSGGVIVNVASVEAISAFKQEMAPYIASKAGVLGLTRALAREYGREGFRVNALVPGGIKTPGTLSVAKRVVTEAKVDLIKTGYDFMQRVPMGRVGLPEEVAAVALFLASDLSSYVHGAAIPVDGGFLSA